MCISSVENEPRQPGDSKPRAQTHGRAGVADLQFANRKATFAMSLLRCHFCDLRLPDFCLAVEVRPQRLWNDDGSVLLLVVLEDGNERAADGEPRSVQRVNELRFAAAAGAELDVGAAGLESFGVAAGRN